MNTLIKIIDRLAPWLYAVFCWAAVGLACFNTKWLWLFVPAVFFAVWSIQTPLQKVIVVWLLPASLSAQNQKLPIIYDTMRADALVIDSAGTFGDALLLYKEIIVVSVYEISIIDGFGRMEYGDLISRTFYLPSTWAILPDRKILTYKLKR